MLYYSQFYITINFIVPPACRVVGGQSRKMAKPIFGRGLAMRCERSEHGKSQLSIKYLCSILIFNYLSLSSVFFASQWHCTSRIASNVLAAWRQAGVSVRLGRVANSQNPAKCPTRQHPRLRQTARYLLPLTHYVY